jgi:uncharacterized protein YcbK (DUF882 family)
MLSGSAAAGKPPAPERPREQRKRPAAALGSMISPLVARTASYGPVDLYAPGSNERLLFRPFDGKGRPRKDAPRELSHFLRCAHTGQEHAVDQRLVPVLYRVGRHFGKQVVIFSGYRPWALRTRAHSRHLTAAAIDFNIPGVRSQDLVRFLRGAFHPLALGIGYYPDGAHVHLDVDRRYDAYWVTTGSDALPLASRLPHLSAWRKRLRPPRGPDRGDGPTQG